MPHFSTVSAERLATCHPDLQRLMNEVVKTVDISILCGHRDQKAQNFAFDTGNSKERWPHSRHNSLPSEAVDIAPSPLDWSDVVAFQRLAVVVKTTAARLGIKILWGGDWVTLRDMPHWQLSRI